MPRLACVVLAGPPACTDLYFSFLPCFVYLFFFQHSLAMCCDDSDDSTSQYPMPFISGCTCLVLLNLLAVLLFHFLRHGNVLALGWISAYIDGEDLNLRLSSFFSCAWVK